MTIVYQLMATGYREGGIPVTFYSRKVFTHKELANDYIEQFKKSCTLELENYQNFKIMDKISSVKILEIELVDQGIKQENG